VKLAASISLCFIATCITQAQSNTRFDGTWIGKENAIPPPKGIAGYERFVPPPKKVTIIIAQNGALVGYLGGNCPGRYENVLRSGNTLNFGAGNCKFTLRLSQDGKTLTEEGSTMIPVQTANTLYHGSYTSIVMPLQLRGTFQRQ
jgi:hypothetical protein